MFIDYAKIRIISGAGGNGCISFRREKYVPRGGPNGGDGGKGGSIIFRASLQLSTLIDFRYKKTYKAGRGQHGMGGDKTGKDGKDEIITVPCGCVIKNSDTNKIISELIKDGEEVLVLKGGRGGRGNTKFKTSTNQAPRKAEKGEPGKELTVVIELKLIADVGLVGFPNAGKSTLISSISSAKPKIAVYPFTTLTPNLGIVRYKEHNSFVVADIPGIIEGASEGKGLGLRFLKHIERTKLLVLLLDLSNSKTEQGNIMNDYHVLIDELKKYQIKLLNKPRLICFTKSDLISKERRNEIEKLKTEEDKIIISSITGENLELLKDMMWKKLKKL